MVATWPKNDSLSFTDSTLICGDFNQGIWMQSGTYTTSQKQVSQYGWLQLISNSNASQVVHVPLWYAAILILADLSFDCKVVHIPHAQNYVLKDGCIRIYCNCKDSKVVHVPPHRITPTKLSLTALSLYATFVTLAALSFECKVVHIPPLRIKSHNKAG